MNRSNSDISEWPTRGYIHGAIDILERIHLAKGHVSAIPAECRPASWKLPQLIYDLLDWWVLDEDCRIAFLGFAQSPAVILMGWMLERARMGGRELTALDFQDVDYARLTQTCGQLARRKILVQSAGFADSGAFYTQVQRIAAEYGIDRVIAQDCCLRNGRRLSEESIPADWQATCQFLDVGVVLCGRHDAGVREEAETAGPPSRATILIVDDTDSVRDCLQFVLKRWGFSVIKAGSSEEALRLSGGICVDLMISDINRPGMNGLDFLPVFRQLHPNTPVIFVSACLFDTFRARAIRLGVAGLLSKPFRLDGLRDVLRQAGLSIDPSL